MTDAVIVSTARTPLAKSWKGAFNMTHGATLGGHAIEHAVKRAGIDPGEVEDVLMGCQPRGATGWNIARQALLRAGLPDSVSGVTVNRFCSSGLQTIAMAAQRVIAGEGDVYVAGGVNGVHSCVQREMNLHMFKDSWLDKNKPTIYWNMMQTAENVAKTLQHARKSAWISSAPRASKGLRRARCRQV